jgi:hypothetical protein
LLAAEIADARTRDFDREDQERDGEDTIRKGLYSRCFRSQWAFPTSRSIITQPDACDL